MALPGGVTGTQARAGRCNLKAAGPKGSMRDARKSQSESQTPPGRFAERTDDLESGAGLERLESQRHQVLRNARAMIFELGADGELTHISPSLTDVLGYDPAEVLAADTADWIHEDDRGQVEEMYQKLVESGQSQKSIYRARHKDGRWLWLETTFTSYRVSDGETHVIALSHDVTELKHTSQALHRSEARYRALAENASDLILELDDRGRHLFVSPNCEEFIGKPAEELLGKTIFESGIDQNIDPADIREIAEIFRGTIRATGRGQFASRYLHPDGRWRWFESAVKRYQTEDGETRHVNIVRDVTERMEAEQRLRQSEERFRALAETSHYLVTELDADGHLIYASPNCRELLGYAPEEMLGTLRVSNLHPEDIEDAVAAFLRVMKSVGPVKPISFRVRHRDGSYRWFESSGVNYRADDESIHMVAVSHDITEARREEEDRRRLEDRMQHAQKLESLGVMAGGIAHDFNNLLTPILGEASLSLMDLPTESPLRQRLDRIVNAAHRAATLTGQMLAYAGTESLRPERLDISRIIREMAQLIESATTRKAVLEYDLGRDLPAIEADAAQLSQMAMSLITNASEALGEDTGRIVIRTGTVEANRTTLSQAFLGDGLAEGTYVTLEVSDNGCGIDPETRARIFDPFYTTKFTGRGLGLAAVLGIVRTHRGAIEIETEPGAGTRFRVLFPVAQEPAITTDDPDNDDFEWRGSGTVLMVDDDESVLEVGSETLERAGFDVIRVTDAPEAIEIFRLRADEIQLVLLDRTMPAMSGEETLERLRKIRPDVRIVLVSGYSEASTRESFVGKGLAGFLHKPFLPRMLIRKVREALQS